MNRTGSIGSARAAGGDHDVPARQVGLAGRRLDERRACGGPRCADRAPSDGGDDGVDDRRAARPGGPTPDWPDASGPGRRWRRSRSRSRREAGPTLACVAGWVHMSPSIAGATTTGAEVARQAAVTTSPASPLAIAPSQWAVAGATTTRRRASATTMCPIRPSGSSARSVRLDRMTRQRRERQRADEPGRGRGEEDDDVRPLGGQEPQELDRLVGGDRTRDAEADEPAREAPASGLAAAKRAGVAGHLHLLAGLSGARGHRLAAADLGVEDPETLERQVGVDDVHALDRRRPWRRAEARR